MTCVIHLKQNFTDHASMVKCFFTKKGTYLTQGALQRECIERGSEPAFMKGTPWRCRTDSSRDEMSQLHSNILKLLQDKKSVKISTAKLRKLKCGLKKLHEESTGCAQESSGYFAVPLQNQQQETSTLTNGPVPHFLESVTQYILRNYATQEGIIRKNGNERRVMGLKDRMEKNGAFIPPGEYSVHDVTCVLKRWLRCLPEPVVPRVLHDIFVKCVELDSHHHSTQALLLTCLLLPTFHLNTLKHIAVFLQEIAKNDLCNKMTSENLAKVLAPSLMPRVVKGEMDPEVVKKFSKSATTALKVLIDNAPMIGVLPLEYEALRNGKMKDFSEDDLSDCEGPLEKHNPRRMLFTFLKSKGSATHQRASALRTPQQPSKRVASVKNVPQSCPPKMTKAALNDRVMKLSGGASGSKQQTPPSKQNKIVRNLLVARVTGYSSGVFAQESHLGNLSERVIFESSKSPFRSPPLQNEMTATTSRRPTRSVSRRFQMENEELREERQEKRHMDGDIVDDSALKQQLTDDNTAALFIEENTACRSKVRLLRSQASVRSLPAQSSHKSLLQHTQHQRASVRRSATLRAAMKFSCAPQTTTTNTTRATGQSAVALSTLPSTAWAALVRRSPSARGVVARKASLRDSVGFRCSPRKPPRTTRLTDGGVKARVQHAKVELSIESLEPPQRGENYHLTGARNDSTGLEQQQQTSSNLNKNNGASSRSTDAGGLRRKNSATQPMPSPAVETANEVATIIERLSVTQGNPSVERKKNARRSLRLSSGAQDKDNTDRNLGEVEHDPKKLRGDVQLNDGYTEHWHDAFGDDGFILRTAKDDVNNDENRDNSTSTAKEAHSGDNFNNVQLVSGETPGQPTSSSSLISEMVTAVKWRVSQRNQEYDDANCVLDNSGTCVDSEDETENFVDAVEFMNELSKQQQQQQEERSQDNRHYLRETRACFISGMLDTPVRAASAETEQSPNSRRESVIAIRVSRAGFVKRNVREIENTFATPIGKASRSRYQNTPSTSHLSTSRIITAAATPMTAQNSELPHHKEPRRRPLTPGNSKKDLVGERFSKTKVMTSPTDI
ncbi:uncharacterized protein LOC111263862 isoform X1 [Varroa jacobsoni]|uniref:uncharacterized protein LOC111263862 isoform X1 n=2 Tax=Varroa jacobsoni TaxID=62625 RepID=UPI000BF48789|nr:uncharacterized protein LOC111263862 isoform X1 [Varroa jacobsoni]